MMQGMLRWLGFGRSIQNPAVPLSASNIIEYLGGGSRTSSGEIVDEHRALTYSPVWQAVDVISSDVSRLPLLVYRRLGEGKERATTSPVYRILRRHTGEMTSNLWLSRLVAQALVYGNGYTQIVRQGGRIVRLKWLHANQVLPAKDNGQLVYKVQYRQNQDGIDKQLRINPTDMFHLVGLSLDDVGGLSLIQYARNCIGRQLAAEHFSDDFFSNLAVPAGWFEHPGEMSADAQKRFLSLVEKRHSGGGRRFKTGILEEGMKWNPSGITPEDSLLIDSLSWGVKDVARFFSIPPHRLGDDARTSYNSLEQENRSYFLTTLGKWVSRIEAEANEKLFTEAEKTGDEYFAEFLQDALYKADMSARHQSYALAIQWGWMSRNEVRARENLNPYEGGDEYLTPLNMQTGDDDADTTDTEAGEDIRAILAQELRFCGRMLCNGAARSATTGSKFWAYLNSHGQKYRPKLQGILAASGARAGLGGQDIAELTDSLISGTTEALLRASECDESVLADRIREALPEVYELCDRLAESVLEQQQKAIA